MCQLTKTFKRLNLFENKSVTMFYIENMAWTYANKLNIKCTMLCLYLQTIHEWACSDRQARDGRGLHGEVHLQEPGDQRSHGQHRLPVWGCHKTKTGEQQVHIIIMLKSEECHVFHNPCATSVIVTKPVGDLSLYFKIWNVLSTLYKKVY